MLNIQSEIRNPKSETNHKSELPNFKTFWSFGFKYFEFVSSFEFRASNFSQTGQVVIALLLTILVGLSIGLIVTQRTITDVTTSSQTETSSRAFSAAEAGIERALTGATATIQTSETGNESTATIQVNSAIPKPGQALEYLDAFGKDKTAQFWLADPDTADPTLVANPGYPANTRLFLYFGNRNDSPVIETYFVYDTGNNTNYQSSSKLYFDTTDRSTENGITNICSSSDQTKFLLPSNGQITTTSSTSQTADRDFKCRVELRTPPSPARSIMLRVRVLYTNNSQPMALAPDTAVSAKLPTQAAYYYSTGKAGQSQKTITIFQQKKLLDSFLDFALYSNTSLTK